MLAAIVAAAATPPANGGDSAADTGAAVEAAEKLTTSKLARKVGLSTAELTKRLLALGLLELRDGKAYLTEKGKGAGGEFRLSPKYGPYFLWPAELAF